MVLSRVALFEYPADAGTISAYQHEQILDDVQRRGELIDDLDVRQPLFAGAHFVLALQD